RRRRDAGRARRRRHRSRSMAVAHRPRPSAQRAEALTEPSGARPSGTRVACRAMSFVLLDRPRPHVALVTLNRPERMNAMAFDVMIPLRRALEELSLDNDTRVVVLTGAGDAFCSGADLEDSGVVPD